MGHFDWDTDDLLNFDYGRPVPGRNSTTEENENHSAARRNEAEVERNRADEAQLYAALRRQIEDKQKQDQLREYQESQRRAELRAQQEAERQAQLRAQQEAERQAQLRAQQEAERQAQLRTQQEAEAKRQAQLEAYERYRAQSRNDNAAVAMTDNDNRRAEKRSRRKSPTNTNRQSDKLYKFTRILSVFYIIFAIVFAVSMTVMNVLPLLYLILMFVILGGLSFILITQLRKENIKKWARVFALIMSIILMFIYGVGTAYALGTLSFLGTTTVKNEKGVGTITKDPFNVVMTGMDVTGTIDESGRSDVNMIVTVNPQTATILMTSIPRDYEIRMPDKGYATDKLTHTGFYSVDTTIQAEEDLLDIESNYYVKVNFSTVTNFINAIGGVDVYSEYEFVPVKMKSWTVQEGVNHMNGEQALAFARERKAFLTGDNQRIKNQQAVFEALINKATSSTTVAISYGKILNQLSDYFEMSFSSGEIRSLIKYQIAKSPDWKIYKNTLSGSGANKTTYTGGSQELYVMEQDPTSVANAKVLINAVVNGQELTEDEDGNVSVAE